MTNFTGWTEEKILFFKAKGNIFFQGEQNQILKSQIKSFKIKINFIGNNSFIVLLLLSI